MTQSPATPPLQRYRITHTSTIKTHIIHPITNNILCTGHTPEPHEIGPLVTHENLPEKREVQTSQLCTECLHIATKHKHSQNYSTTHREVNSPTLRNG